MQELELIRRIHAGSRSRNPQVRLGIGDDCAILRPHPGEEMLITTDFSLEGRHFRRDWHTAESAGHRCLARGLSDIAAMGGRPIAAFLSLALPPGFEVAWVDGFLHGLQTLADRFAVELAGGDTSQTEGREIAADIVLVGTAPVGKALLRSGARVGDEIYVTGRLGGAAVELEERRAGAPPRQAPAQPCPQSFPEPRVQVGTELLRLGYVTSCMDLSDGLSLDLRRLCEASGTGAEIAALGIPIAPGATLQQALDGGEDYELLFTAHWSVKVPNEICGVKVSRIGRIAARDHGLRIVAADLSRTELQARGWEHFAPE